ncbi:SRPBCC family protein [Umezawaea sp. Da 62-37]|uniref:SRPBCC family protein n=1 Tax=Umezawaea sp. Da 62-37 TaxID=3075927 RepID=UPI0028F6EABB|nr:SRPBCC family protein [Umezawaea sp. Da 62-37]WNV84424.1 SRPBCC family protein [Umezawaea sp. Da 62-37]
MTPRATLETLQGHPVLRFQRTLPHSPIKVWRAITRPTELAAWFPATVQFDLTPGARIHFTFPEGAPVDDGGTGEVLEVDPPKVFAFRWNSDVLRFELVPTDDGCVLHFTQVLGDRLSAGRNAFGWDTCLAVLDAHLDGRTHTPSSEFLAPLESYIREFHLDEGTFDGTTAHFARDLVWKPATDIWTLLTGDTNPQVGDAPPPRATNPHVPTTPLTEVTAPHVLAYGPVRWEITQDPALGTRVELTHTPPADADPALVLAAWHAHLELLFAAAFGEIRCPWPQDRTDELHQHYTHPLASRTPRHPVSNLQTPPIRE